MTTTRSSLSTTRFRALVSSALAVVMYLAVIDVAGPQGEAEIQAQSCGTPVHTAALTPDIDAVSARVAARPA